MFGLNVYRVGDDGKRAVVVLIPASVDEPHLIYTNKLFGSSTILLSMDSRRITGLWLMGLGGALGVLGVIAGMMKRGYDGVCGTAWNPSAPPNAIDEFMCKDDIGAWPSVAWTLTVVGVIALFGGVLLLVAHSTAPNAPAATPPRPLPRSIASELAEVARLRDTGALTEAEFKAAKREVLGEGQPGSASPQ